MSHYGLLFQSILGKGSTPIPVEDYGWQNHIFESEMFRRGHVEIFTTDKLMVLHVTVFPHLDDPAPIYGFDVISGAEKASGIFLDLSPTVGKTAHFCETPAGATRIVPEWGEIFSPHFVAVRPRNDDEFIDLLQAGMTVLENYLPTLRTETADVEAVRTAQNRYCAGQRRNEKTMSALVRLIGAERANQFMTTVLFPDA
jgi:phycocyanobilin:ferredoxin oxidoreductase